jgi:hypothetical protein
MASLIFKKQYTILYLLSISLLVEIIESRESIDDKIFRLPLDEFKISDGVYLVTASRDEKSSFIISSSSTHSSIKSHSSTGRAYQGLIYVHRRLSAHEEANKNNITRISKRGNIGVGLIESVIDDGHEGDNNMKNEASNSCYKLNANGYRWKHAEPFFVDPRNEIGLNEEFILTSIGNAVTEWNNNLSVKNRFISLDNMSVRDIESPVNTDFPNENNEVVMGYLEDDSVIAVTITWGIFSGPISQREIIEFDMVFNQRYNFGDASRDKTKMDYWSIVIHEWGHVLGKGDVYSRSCDYATMYGLSSEGETHKRSLSRADIQGLRILYNEK